MDVFITFVAYFTKELAYCSRSHPKEYEFINVVCNSLTQSKKPKGKMFLWSSFTPSPMYDMGYTEVVFTLIINIHISFSVNMAK